MKVKHEEWKGKRDLVMDLLKKANLDNIDNANEKKIIMREIVICKYLEYMTVEETIARVMIEYNIELTKSKYYRIYNEVMTVLENIIQSDED